ncbi:hypothetical protein, unlikely [Trypanosoma brucei brucei TREU927]|uniref:Uncharacterized protein n=1 Tax=Trypanosoma brucei brucei (strain 927/4 GUTat10.1) TaxID=185431 RepID=Q4GYL6_TRYB2|nr:hypothetical protein, unlikely [Trypanosoma brucei brucei TREU927]CAJ16568.1 hypothetical protein, unlikely [Trypanosoma brucei brucei TREU927]
MRTIRGIQYYYSCSGKSSILALNWLVCSSIQFEFLSFIGKSLLPQQGTNHMLMRSRPNGEKTKQNELYSCCQLYFAFTEYICVPLPFSFLFCPFLQNGKRNRALQLSF